MSRRYRDAQRNRTLHHPRLPQGAATKDDADADADEEEDDNDTSNGAHREGGRVVVVTESKRQSRQHTFVVCADTQLGMTNSNSEWETELAYARRAVLQINALDPRPTFCCCCGDLVDMEHTFHINSDVFTRDECDDIRNRQNLDFQEVWSHLHPSIAMVCICGNHDIGNTPTKESIERFRDAFGDDYLAFWTNGTYNIVVNSCLFSDPSEAYDLYESQLRWLEDRLVYANERKAASIFVFGHHPWFLYREDEEDDQLTGMSAPPPEWGPSKLGDGFPDWYFHIPKEYRMRVMELFRLHGVDAAFSGHFHQNLLSESSWGMNMIITGPLSCVFDSTGKPPSSSEEPNVRGFRVVTVDVPEEGKGSFRHHFEPLA